MVAKTLDEMAAGGMYDLLGGGFHRYSVDDRWLVPHFEKMLYDNALLAAAYLHGWLVTGDDRYREVASATIEYMLRELLLPEGGFASAQDADTDGVEGLTFTWTEDEGAPAELLEPFEHGRSIIRGDVDAATRARLFELREQRPKPLRDDKAIASWNGLALAALAEAPGVSSGRTGSRPRATSASSCSARSRTTTAGCGAAGATAARVGRLSRRLRQRRARPARAARRDRRAPLARGGEPAGAAGGRALRRRGARWLLPLGSGRRAPGRATKQLDDHPLPSGNAMLAHVLLRLARIYGDDELERLGVAVLRLVRPALERAPAAFGWALCALDLHLSPPRELAIVGPVDSEVARAALAPWQPHTVVAVGQSDHVPLLAGKTLVDGKPAVYVCERFACQAPVTDPAELSVSGA